MPTFISFVNWTDQGIRNVKDAPKRAKAASSSSRGCRAIDCRPQSRRPQMATDPQCRS